MIVNTCIMSSTLAIDKGSACVVPIYIGKGDKNLYTSFRSVSSVLIFNHIQ